MSDLQTALERAERHAHAPLIIQSVIDEYDTDTLAEICAEVSIGVVSIP